MGGAVDVLVGRGQQKLPVIEALEVGMLPSVVTSLDELAIVMRALRDDLSVGATRLLGTDLSTGDKRSVRDMAKMAGKVTRAALIEASLTMLEQDFGRARAQVQAALTSAQRADRWDIWDLLTFEKHLASAAGDVASTVSAEHRRIPDDPPRAMRILRMHADDAARAGDHEFAEALRAALSVRPAESDAQRRQRLGASGLPDMLAEALMFAKGPRLIDETTQLPACGFSIDLVVDHVQRSNVEGPDLLVGTARGGAVVTLPFGAKIADVFSHVLRAGIVVRAHVGLIPTDDSDFRPELLALTPATTNVPLHLIEDDSLPGWWASLSELARRSYDDEDDDEHDEDDDEHDGWSYDEEHDWSNSDDDGDELEFDASRQRVALMDEDSSLALQADELDDYAEYDLDLWEPGPTDPVWTSAHVLASLRPREADAQAALPTSAAAASVQVQAWRKVILHSVASLLAEQVENYPVLTAAVAPPLRGIWANPREVHGVLPPPSGERSPSTSGWRSTAELVWGAHWRPFPLGVLPGWVVARLRVGHEDTRLLAELSREAAAMLIAAVRAETTDDYGEAVVPVGHWYSNDLLDVLRSGLTLASIAPWEGVVDSVAVAIAFATAGWSPKRVSDEAPDYARLRVWKSVEDAEDYPTLNPQGRAVFDDRVDRLPEFASLGLSAAVAVRAAQEGIPLSTILACRKRAECLVPGSGSRGPVGSDVEVLWERLDDQAKLWLRLRSGMQEEAWSELVGRGVPEPQVVLFLEQCAAVGAEVSAAAAWARCGIFPQERELWRDAGLDRPGAQRWRPFCTPEEAAEFRAQGLNLTQVKARRQARTRGQTVGGS